MKNDIISRPDEASTHFHFHLDDKGLGRTLTTGTQVLIQLAFCDSKHEQLRILDNVLKHLEINPDDFEVMRRNTERNINLDYNDEPYSWERNDQSNQKV